MSNLSAKAKLHGMLNSNISRSTRQLKLGMIAEEDEVELEDNSKTKKSEAPQRAVSNRSSKRANPNGIY